MYCVILLQSDCQFNTTNDVFSPFRFVPPEWADIHFPDRNLKAYSAYPTLVSPTHKWGVPGYVSDTTSEDEVEEEEVEALKHLIV